MPNVQANRRAAPILAKCEDTCRPVRLSVGLGATSRESIVMYVVVASNFPYRDYLVSVWVH